MTSLRWRLQAWHALVLTTVLVVFGTVVGYLHWLTRLQQIDTGLVETADAVLSQLIRLIPPPVPGIRSGPRPPGPPLHARGSRPPPPEHAPFVNADQDSSVPRLPAKRNGDRFPPEDFPRPTDRQHSGHPFFDENFYTLPAEFTSRFDGTGRLYFAIWRRDGTLLQQSAGAPALSFPGIATNPGGVPLRVWRFREGRRELITTVFDLNVLVGRPIGRDVADQRGATAILLGLGGGVLALGLIGGWWISTRAIRPIAKMTETARAVSVRNLSQRIELEDTVSELRQLGEVLNETFDRLQLSFEQQTQFTADASHELRTPVAVILANAELALTRPRTEEEYRAFLSTCLRASQRMKSLIESLLTLARFDAGEPSLKREPIDLEGLVQECVELIRPLADQRQLCVESHAMSVSVEGDRGRLSQVLTNLLSNAVRYNREGGRIAVTLREEGDEAVLEVTDTGVGIPAEDLPRVFDRFYRVDKARSRAEGGSGLGLAICRTIVEAHGGRVSARSTPETGSTFEVRLPRRVPCEPKIAPQPSLTTSGSQ